MQEDPQWATGSKRGERAEHLEQREPDESKKQKLFEQKRKQHYNMKEALAQARKMIEMEEDEMEDDDMAEG